MSTILTDNEIVVEKMKSVIENLLTKLNVKKSNIYDLVPATKPGENWVGIIYKVGTDGTINNKNVNLDLVIKMEPYQEVYREMLPVELMYKRERHIYKNVIPEFIKIQEELGMTSIYQPFAKFYKCDMTNVIIMENLHSKGYVTGNHRVAINYDQTLFVMKEMGKLHALSYAIRDHKPEVFNSLGKSCEETFFSSHVKEHFLKIVTTLGNQIIKSYDSKKDHTKIKRLQKFLQTLPDVYSKILRPEESGQYAVINHGDTQVRNMLFKYEDSSNSERPTQLCFIDWQLARFASPAFDIHFYLYVSTDKQLRDLYYENLIQEYYDSLASFLRKLNSDPDKLLPFKVLKEHISKFSVFGMFMAIWILSANSQESKNVLDVYNITDPEFFVKAFTSGCNEEYIIRIKEVIEDFIKYDYEF